MIKVNKLTKFSLIFLLLFFLPSALQAAVLYLEPAEGLIGPGDSMAIDIKIDVDKDCINTIEAYINYPQDYMRLVNFITGESLINLWVDKPNSFDLDDVNRLGIIHLAGGIPGGYCGRIPGDPGISNMVGRMIFRIPNLIISDTKLTELQVNFLDNSRVLLNDGFGSEDKLTVKGANFRVSKRPLNLKEGWRERIDNDNIPPEPFVIELRQNPAMFDGEYYIIFYTTDKQTGVDHYEVLEIRPEEKIGVQPKRTFLDYLLGWKRKPPVWEQAEMPYLLEDQSLASIIKVRAVDKAGNERMVEYIPSEPTQKIAKKIPYQRLAVIFLVLAGFIVLLVLIFKYIKKIIIFFFNKTKKDKENKNEEEKF